MAADVDYLRNRIDVAKTRRNHTVSVGVGALVAVVEELDAARDMARRTLALLEREGITARQRSK